MSIKVLAIDSIRVDGGTQMRAESPSDAIAEYAAAWKDNAKFPAVIVFFDGENYWLGDGHLRYFAAKRAGLASLAAEVRQGTVRHAILFACGANAAHGARRTSADKRKAVLSLLEDDEWCGRSDRWIADVCKVNHHLVAEIRKSLEKDETADPTERRVGLDGKSYPANSGGSSPTCRDANTVNFHAEDSEQSGSELPPGNRVEATESPQAVAKPEQVDGWGVPIQPHAKDAFEPGLLAKFDEMLTCLRRADRLWSDLCETPAGHFMVRAGVSMNARERWRNRGIKDAIAAAEDTRPTYTVCPGAYHALAFPESLEYGGGVHDETCNLCHGVGWVRSLGRTEVDPKVVAKIKEVFGV